MLWQLAATSPEIQKTACVSPERVSLPGQGRLLKSGGAGGQKSPLGSQVPWVKILPWSWIPLPQDGPWHGWEGNVQEVAVGQVSLGRTSSSTSLGGTTSPPVWGHCCCSSRGVDMNIPTQGESLTKIPLTNVRSGGSSKDKLGIFDNVLQQWDREITYKVPGQYHHHSEPDLEQTNPVCHTSCIILQQYCHHRKQDGESLQINYSVEQLKKQLSSFFS